MCGDAGEVLTCGRGGGGLLPLLPLLPREGARLVLCDLFDAGGGRLGGGREGGGCRCKPKVNRTQCSRARKSAGE